jgi:hypothetical protein
MRRKFIKRATKISVQTLHCQIQTTGRKNSTHTYKKDSSHLVTRLKKECSYTYTLPLGLYGMVYGELYHLVLPFTYKERGCSRVRFPIVSLKFFIDIILPAALWSWGWLSLLQKWVPGIFLGVKAASAYGWQPYHLHLPTVLKSGSLSLLKLSGPAQVCTGIALRLHIKEDICVMHVNVVHMWMLFTCECCSHIQLSF